MTRAKIWLPVLFAVCVLGPGTADAQVRVDADWLFWSRNNDADGPLISGPNSVSADDASFQFNSGYRFTAGGSFGAFDIEASFLQIPDWSHQTNGVLTAPLVFDDPTNAFIAPANFIGFRSRLRAAASDPAFGEDTEIEFLEPGARVTNRYTSTLDSFELNLGTNRSERPVYAAIGWRHVELGESSSLLAVGTFQAQDSNDGALPGGVGDDPNNNGLSDAALTGAGFGLVGGAGDGFAGYDPTNPLATVTTLGVQFQGLANNNLDGAQATFGGRIFPSDVIVVEGFLKLGVYQNRASGAVRETVAGVINDDSVYRRTFIDSKNTASFGTAVGLRFMLPVTDYIFIRYGYEAALFTNMALAPDQAQGVATNLLGMTRYDVVTNGLFIAHGGHLGLEVTW